MIVFYVGDIGSNVRICAQTADPTATLLTQENCKNILSGTYYVSLGDFSDLETFVQTLDLADVLHYVPESHWSDTKKNFSYMKHWTEFYLHFYRHKKIVHIHTSPTVANDLLAMTHLADQRRGPGKQLWIAGCSISHGVGVDPSQRYGQLIANALELPVSFLTKSGASIEWASDQILRSDLRPGDIVIWGITNYTRFPYYVEHSVEHVTVGYYEEHPEFNKIISIDRLNEKNQIYRAVTSIHRVLNFCKKINVDVYLGGMLVTDNFIQYLSHLPNYTQFFGFPGLNEHNLFIDLGSDHHHPGEKTHAWYAQTLLEKIKNE